MFLRRAMSRTIKLTPNEQKLVDLLEGCADWADRKQATPSPIELRIAGGWVRDKLLNIACHDIDISTSPEPLTGLKFATLFQEYLREQGQEALMGKLTAIEAKPEQSKHLETATATVCDLSVDWVQQRGSEVYTGDSRIPVVSFGTSLEDAERRDLTINALFYNIRKKVVEDPLGKGLADLGIEPPNARKRIRTPLEPFQTFRDDPLRVIRTVRFASRFGREFEIDPAVKDAIRRDEIRDSLRDGKKISRERVSVELEKMLLGPNALYSLELINELNLHSLVFLYDASTVVSKSGEAIDNAPDYGLTVKAASILQELLTAPPGDLHALLTFTLVSPPSDLSPEDPLNHHPRSPYEIYFSTTKRLYLECGLLPLYDLYVPVPKKNTLAWVGESVVKSGIKWKNADSVWAVRAHSAFVGLDIPALVRKYSSITSPNNSEHRVELGLFLRNPDVHDNLGTRWNVTLFWSLVAELAISSEAHENVIKRYTHFVNLIQELGLHENAFNAPLLNGKEVQELIPASKGTLAISKILELIVRYQLEHGEQASKDACKTYLTTEAKDRVDQYILQFPKPQPKQKKAHK